MLYILIINLNWMSRVGNSPIRVPEGVTVEIEENKIVVKGKMGELSQDFDGVTVLFENNNIIIKRESEQKDIKSKHGLYRSIINNMVIGCLLYTSPSPRD